MSLTNPETKQRRSRSAWWIGRRLLLGLFLVVALVWLGLSYLSRPGVLLPAHFASPLRTADTPVHIRLAGEDYCLPINYLDAPLDPGLDQEQILLVALLPELEARNRENREEMAQTRGRGRQIRLLITAVGDPASDLANRYNVIESMYGPFSSAGFYFGLNLNNSSEDSRFGRRELYLDPSGNPLDGFISCRLPGDVQSPSCQHEYIVSDRFVIRATYGREFLPDWDSIVGRIELRFDAFRAATDCR